MQRKLEFAILPQPDDTTCGPTCLHALYRYYDDHLPLLQVIREAPRLEEGEALAVQLAIHALQRGYRAKIYTYNLLMFDPTWFVPEPQPLAEKLRQQLNFKDDPKLQTATLAYLEYLEAGGTVVMEDLTADLIFRHLQAGKPILTGLSSTYLYRQAREWGPNDDDDDIRGKPAGHFVVLYGYDARTREISVADPLWPNPLAAEHLYTISIERVICAILLGIVTYDANLLIVEPSTPEPTP